MQTENHTGLNCPVPIHKSFALSTGVPFTFMHLILVRIVCIRENMTKIFLNTSYNTQTIMYSGAVKLCITRTLSSIAYTNTAIVHLHHNLNRDDYHYVLNS